MKASWNEVLLKDLIVLHDAKRIPLSGQQRALRKGPYPYHGATGVVDYVDDYLFDGDYILLGEDGSVITDKNKPVLQFVSGKIWVNNHAHVITASSKVDFRFLYYNLADLNIRPAVTGAVQMKVSQANLLALKTTLPPLPTQRRIAAVLGALDDAIELNRKMNANLEAQAQALFKSWFVDFAPWGGKMPKEWKMGTLGEVCCKLTDGSHFSPKDDPSSNIPMLSVKDMCSDDFDYSKCKHISEVDFEGMSANGCVPLIDDILVAKDGSYLKSIFIINESKRQAVLSSIAIFRPDQRVVRPEYLLNLLRQPLILKDVKRNYVSGTGVPRIVLKDFRRYPVIVPPLEVQDKINGALHEIRMMMAMNIEESRKLAETRDALLPKLMSGEVEVE